MPYMRVSTSKTLTAEQKQSLYEKLGAALAVIPGKEAFMLIADIEDGRQIYSGGGPSEDFVFIDARYYSRIEYHVKKAFVKAVLKAVGDVVGTPKERISMTVLEMNSWGGFGDMADVFYSDPED